MTHDVRVLRRILEVHGVWCFNILDGVIMGVFRIGISIGIGIADGQGRFLQRIGVGLMTMNLKRGGKGQDG